MPYMRAVRKPHSGFTLVEVLVVAPIMLLTIGVFVGLLITITGEVLVARTSNKVAYDTQAALDMIEQDIRTSGSFLSTNNVSISSPQGSDEATAAFNVAQANKPLILNALATTGGAYEASRSPVWLPDTPYPCNDTTKRIHNQVMTYNIVYFLRDNTLWRRVIMPPNYTSKSCSGQTPDQQPTCAPNRTESICAAQDTRVLDNVQNFAVRYYAAADNTTTPLSNATISTGTTAHIDITANKTVAGEDITYTGTMRATRVGSSITYATP